LGELKPITDPPADDVYPNENPMDKERPRAMAERILFEELTGPAGANHLPR